MQEDQSLQKIIEAKIKKTEEALKIHQKFEGYFNERLDSKPPEIDSLRLDIYAELMKYKEVLKIINS